MSHPLVVSSDPLAQKDEGIGGRKHKVGHTFGDLTLKEYAPPSKGGTRAVFTCACGNDKELRVGNVTSGLTRNCADRDNHPDPRIKSDPAVNTAHARITRLRGPAKNWPCCFCGKQADHWSYRHAAVRPLIQQSGKDAGQIYSDDPADYFALCRRHHKAWDRGHAALGIPEGYVSGVHAALALAYDPYGDA